MNLPRGTRLPPRRRQGPVAVPVVRRRARRPDDARQRHRRRRGRLGATVRYRWRRGRHRPAELRGGPPAPLHGPLRTSGAWRCPTRRSDRTFRSAARPWTRRRSSGSGPGSPTRPTSPRRTLEGGRRHPEIRALPNRSITHVIDSPERGGNVRLRSASKDHEHRLPRRDRPAARGAPALPGARRLPAVIHPAGRARAGARGTVARRPASTAPIRGPP